MLERAGRDRPILKSKAPAPLERLPGLRRIANCGSRGIQGETPTRKSLESPRLLLPMATRWLASSNKGASFEALASDGRVLRVFQTLKGAASRSERRVGGEAMSATLKISDELAVQATGQTLGVAGHAISDVIHVCSDPMQLDEIGRLLWKGYGEGSIGEREAEYLSSMIERRRPLGRRTAPLHTRPVAGRLWSRFTARQRQGSPDRKASRDRRRMLGGSSALPDNLRHYYTEGQRAVLCIVAGEVKHHGICDLPIDKIAALAGVSRTSVQTAMHEARRLGHIKVTERPQRRRKSLTNVVEIICQDGAPGSGEARLPAGP